MQSIALAAFVVALGFLLADWAVGRRDVGAWVRLGLALPALLGYVLALTVLHIVTGGALFSEPWAVKAVSAGALLILLLRKLIAGRNERTMTSSERWALTTLLALALVIWGAPVVQLFPLDHTIDTPMHMGWATQILNGETTPSSPFSGRVPNSYPWLHHFGLAFLACFAPGGTPWHAQGALQLLLVTGSVLGLFALGRELTERWSGAAATALFAALCGGFGFLLARAPTLVASPAGARPRYLGDLLMFRPWNVSFFNLSPPFPRDLAVALLPAFLLLLVLGMRRSQLWCFVAAGLVLGLVGLSHGDAMLVGLGVASLVSLFSPETGRTRTALAIFVPALSAWALWLAPLLVSYGRYGFRQLGGFERDLGPLATLAAWGITTPFALYGLARWGPGCRKKPDVRVVAAMLVAAVAMLVLATLIPSVFGSGFAALGYRKRYWSLLHLGIALFGALGLAAFFERLFSARRGLAVAAAAIVLLFALPSPVLGSLAVEQRFRGLNDRQLRPLGAPADRDLIYASVRGEARTLLSRLAPSPGRMCTIAVPWEMSYRVFSFTGYRQVHFLRGKAPFMRWRDIWDDIGLLKERALANHTLVRAPVVPHLWRRAAEEYDVDAIVMTAKRAGHSMFSGLKKQSALPINRTRYTIVWRSECSRGREPR